MNEHKILNNLLDTLGPIKPTYHNINKIFEMLNNSENDEMENPASAVYYTERTPEKFKIYAVIPGVSKTDLTAKFIDTENNKQIIVRVKNYADKNNVNWFSHLEFLKNPLKISVPSDTTNPVLKLENGILEIQLDYVENTRKTEVLDIL